MEHSLSDIVTALRLCAADSVCEDCPYNDPESAVCGGADADAADAIENMMKECAALRKQIGNLMREKEQLATELHEIKSESGWNSVKEKLPDRNGAFLCAYHFELCEGASKLRFTSVLEYYATDREPHFQHEGLHGLTVTDWMELPKLPPREVEHGT